MKIICDGERHLGAAIGSKEFRESYVSTKVAKWVKDVEELSTIATDEPQAALSAFTKALCHRWTFVQRTIPDTKHLFIPLESCIRDRFIPAVIGRKVSDIHRSLFALPVRYGGLGITNPVETADREYETSLKLTEDLTTLICNQETSLRSLDREKIESRAKGLKLLKETQLKTELSRIMNRLDQAAHRSLHHLQEPGAGACFTALPLARLSYYLNKVEFRDSVFLRYGWEIPNTPKLCSLLLLITFTKYRTINNLSRMSNRTHLYSDMCQFKVWNVSP